MKTTANKALRFLLLAAGLTLLEGFVAEEVLTASWYDRVPSAVDASAMKNHSREVLGKHWKSIVGKGSTDVSNVSVFVYEVVLKRLPKAYKHQAWDVAESIISGSEKYGFDPVFVLAMIQNESSFRPEIVGVFGEIGLLQLKPETARWYAKKIGFPFIKKKTLQNPAKNIQLGLAYLDYLRGKLKNDARYYIAAYNMGAGNVRRLAKKNVIPTFYSGRVMAHYRDLYKQLSNRIRTAKLNLADIDAKPTVAGL